MVRELERDDTALPPRTASGARRRAPPPTERMAVPYPGSQSIGLAMRIALFGLRAAFKQILARHKVPWSAWYYLRVLYEFDGITQQELTQRVGTMQPNTVSALRNLERAAMVRIERDDADRRRTYVWLTPKARRLMEKLVPEMANAGRVAVTNFTAEEEQELIRLLHKVCDNLNHVAPAAARRSKVKS